MLHLPNTWSGALEPFVPLSDVVRLYSCGPTVYSFAHIGNFRSFLSADVLRRVLERRGYVVRHVMNITDVGHLTEDHLADAGGEDKLQRAARELGADPFKIARHFEALFVEDARRLGLKNQLGAEGADTTLHPRATRYLPEMLALIQKLLERGHAYVDPTGQVYFEISTFPSYGRLSGKVAEELEAGSRVEVRTEKRDPRDFALWKVDPKHLMQWDPHGPTGWEPEDWARLQALVPAGVDPRVGRGFPGWHIECSAMSLACLGEVIDIHTGGEDNVFPHHECEIAQSVAALGVSVTSPDGVEMPTFARYWMHGRHLLVDGRKMSKRDGTFLTLRDLVAPGDPRPAFVDRLAEVGFPGGRVSPAVVRAALIGTAFTLPLNFTVDALVQARTFVDRLQDRWDRLGEVADDAPTGDLSAWAQAFDAALDDGLDMAGAFAAVSQAVAAVPTAPTPGEAAAWRALLAGFDDVLGLLDRAPRSGRFAIEELTDLGGGNPLRDALAAGRLPTPEELAAAPAAEDLPAWLATRRLARAAKDWGLADRLRASLAEQGFTVEDRPDGVRWVRR